MSDSENTFHVVYEDSNFLFGFEEYTGVAIEKSWIMSKSTFTLDLCSLRAVELRPPAAIEKGLILL